MKEQNSKKQLLKTAFLDSVPILAGYVVLGAGFGIILKSKGYGVLWAIAMSVFIYAGSMQYVAIDLLAGGASLISAAVTTLLINARHAFYGISMIEQYRDAGKKRPYLIFALTDETYSLVCGKKLPEGINKHNYYFLVSLFDQIYWIAGSVLGSALGSVLKISFEGIDFALTALFVTVFVEQWLSTKDHIYAITGVVSSVLCLIIFGSGSFLIPSMVLITLSLTLLRRFRKEGADA